MRARKQFDDFPTAAVLAYNLLSVDDSEENLHILLFQSSYSKVLPCSSCIRRDSVEFALPPFCAYPTKYVTETLDIRLPTVPATLVLVRDGDGTVNEKYMPGNLESDADSVLFQKKKKTFPHHAQRLLRLTCLISRS